MRLKFSFLLLSCLTFASCSNTMLVGDWHCDDTDVEHDLFTVHVDNRVTYSGDGTYLSRFKTTFDFLDVGKVFATLVISGTWRLEENVLVEKTGQSSVSDFSTVTSIAESNVAKNLIEQHPAGEVLRTEVTFVDSDRVQMLDLGEDPEPEYFCVRQH